MPERSIDRGPLVLVVEEDARKRERIRRVFARHGYQVDAAEGEREAIAKVREIPFDVALLSAHLTEGTSSSRAPRPSPLGATPHTNGLPKQLQRLRPEIVCL